MDKFDELKNEINESGKKFEGYQSEIESKKMEIQLLETQITNVKLTKTKYDKVSTEVAEDKNRTKKQLETLKGLISALGMQL